MMHWTPRRPRHRHLDSGSSGTTHDEGRSCRRRRQTNDAMPSEVSHLAVWTLTRGTYRVLARRTPSHQLHHSLVATTTSTTNPSRPRTIHRHPGCRRPSTGRRRQAGWTAHVRPSRSRAGQLLVTRSTEGVEARQRLGRRRADRHCARNTLDVHARFCIRVGLWAVGRRRRRHRTEDKSSNLTRFKSTHHANKHTSVYQRITGHDYDHDHDHDH